MREVAGEIVAMHFTHTVQVLAQYGRCFRRRFHLSPRAFYLPLYN